MHIVHKRVFTLIETLISIIIIWVWITAIVTTLRGGYQFMERTRSDIIAINMARQWAEAVYNIRDTNYTRWEGKKDACIFKRDPMNASQGTATDCADDDWIIPYNYILTWLTLGENTYFALTPISSTDLNLTNWLDNSDRQYSMCRVSNSWIQCPNQEPTTDWGRYFRMIKSYGVFDKTASNPDTTLSCTNWNSSGCGTSAPKELRFCSVVEYMNWNAGKVELCWILTNFLK